jgi:isoquinoline 1-oxidoreductase alpha subunit
LILADCDLDATNFCKEMFVNFERHEPTITKPVRRDFVAKRLNFIERFLTFNDAVHSLQVPVAITERVLMSFILEVNGNIHSIDVEPDTPLLWVLRDSIKITGTKYGCGIAACGACSVHIDGGLEKSCQIPASAATGKKITTIEGLSGDSKHPVQQAWAEIDVPQCGYCQSGQIMAAAALLSKTPKPSDAEIDAGMAGNLCRCGTYQRIRKAVRRAAEIAS